MSKAYTAGLSLAIASQWRLYRRWVRKAERAHTNAYARDCLDFAELGRKRAIELEAEWFAANT